MSKLQDLLSFENNYKESFSDTAFKEVFFKAIHDLLKLEELNLLNLSIVWVDDEYLRQLHIDYLNDPTYTDVMTFNYAEGKDLDGELYISIDRAKDHAKKYDNSLKEELCRLIIHGLLHIAGYDDHTAVDKKDMREKENFYLERTIV